MVVIQVLRIQKEHSCVYHLGSNLIISYIEDKQCEIKRTSIQQVAFLQLYQFVHGTSARGPYQHEFVVQKTSSLWEIAESAEWWHVQS